MRGDVWDIRGSTDVRVVARWWLNVAGGHDFFVGVVLVDIVGGHRNVVARFDVVLRPDMVVAKRRQTLEWQTRYWVVNVGDAEVVAHSLSGNVPSEEVVTNSW